MSTTTTHAIASTTDAAGAAMSVPAAGAASTASSAPAASAVAAAENATAPSSAQIERAADAAAPGDTSGPVQSAIAHASAAVSASASPARARNGAGAGTGAGTGTGSREVPAPEALAPIRASSRVPALSSHIPLALASGRNAASGALSSAAAAILHPPARIAAPNVLARALDGALAHASSGLSEQVSRLAGTTIATTRSLVRSLPVPALGTIQATLPPAFTTALPPAATLLAGVPPTQLLSLLNPFSPSTAAAVGAGSAAAQPAAGIDPELQTAAFSQDPSARQAPAAVRALAPGGPPGRHLLAVAARDAAMAGTSRHTPLAHPPVPTPAPAPGGVTAVPLSAAGTGISVSIFLTLAGLLLLAAPRTTRRLRDAGEAWRPAPFVLIPARPG